MHRKDSSWNDPTEGYLSFLRGQGPAPGLGELPADERAKLAELFCTLDAITDMGFDLPPVNDDPARPGAGGLSPLERDAGHRPTAPRQPNRPRHASCPPPPGQRCSRPGDTARAVPGHRIVLPMPQKGAPLRHSLLSRAVLPLVLVLVAGLSAFPTRPSEAISVMSLVGARCHDLPVDTPGRVVVAAVWSGEERRHFVEVLRRFRARTGIDVTLATDPPRADRDIGRTLDDLSARGCAPDVALLPQPGLMADLAGRHRLVPIEDDLGGIVDGSYSSAWRRLGSVGGTLFGVWFKAADKSTIWYRTESFADAGVAVPLTWDELKEVASRLAASGTTPFAIAGQDGWTLTDWFENVYLRTAGPAMYDKLARHEIPWTDPSVTHAMATLAEIFGQREWMVDGADGALGTSFERAVQQVFGAQPRAAMMFEGDFVASHIPKSPARVGLDATFFDFPSLPAAPGLEQTAGAGPPGGMVAGGDVAVLLRDREPAKELLRFLASPEAAEPWVRAGGFTSPNRRVNLAWYPNHASRKAAQTLTSATSVNFDLSDLQPASFGSSPDQGMWTLMREFLADPSDVGGITTRLEAQRSAART